MCHSIMKMSISKVSTEMKLTFEYIYEVKTGINGVLLLNKPQTLSSNIALQKVKRLYNAKKAGHTGTLDPLATGLLPICFGEAAKFSAFLLNADKEYIATIKLGETTTTYDSCGDIVNSVNVNVTANEIKSVVMTFLGEITQIPPIYSALKVNGKRLYEYARNSEEVVIKSRQITIKEIELIEFGVDNTFKIRVLCSKGTYIRTLAHDIGLKLSCGGHLTALMRTKTSSFILDESINLDSLAQMSYSERQSLLLPVDVLVSGLDKLKLYEDEFFYIKNGRSFNNTYAITDGKLLRLYYKDSFLGVAEVLNNLIKPIRLMNLA